MNAGRQAAWLFVALMALACSSWYFASTTPVAKLDDRTLSSTADAIITDLTVKKFDAKGQLANYLKTPLMHHIPFNNTHLLTTPLIIIAQQNQPAWEISAQQATSLHGGEEITFVNDVVIHQGKDAHTQESTLKTQVITYFAKDKVAKTEADVTYEQPGNIIQSTGMNAYLAEKRVQLLHQARGTYVPTHG